MEAEITREERALAVDDELPEVHDAVKLLDRLAVNVFGLQTGCIGLCGDSADEMVIAVSLDFDDVPFRGKPLVTDKFNPCSVIFASSFSEAVDALCEILESGGQLWSEFMTSTSPGVAEWILECNIAGFGVVIEDA